MAMRFLYIFIISLFFIGCLGEIKPEKKYSQKAQALNELTNRVDSLENMTNSSDDEENDMAKKEIGKSKLPILNIIKPLIKGKLSYVNNDYEKAIDYYGKSRKILKRQKNIQYGNSKNTIKHNEGSYAYDMVLSDYRETIFNELEYYIRLNIGKSYLGICQRLEDNHNSLKYCKEAIHHLEEARIFLSKTKYKNKIYTDVTYHLGFSYTLRKDADNGRIHLNKANKKRIPAQADRKIYGEGRTFTALGILYTNNAKERQYNKKEYKKILKIAKQNFEKALKLEPENDAFINNVGEINYRLGNYEKAIKYYDEAIFINPIDPILYNNRGLAYLKYKQSSQACRDFEITKELDTHNVIQNIYENLISDGVCR